MRKINVGVIGTGWCGGIRANTCASSALVGELHIAEVNVERLREVQKETNPTFATNDYHELIYSLENPYTVSLIPPTITMSFGTDKALSASDVGSLCNIWAEEPVFTVSVK